MSTKSIWSILHFCRINLYGLECFRCVCHELLSRIYLTLLLSVWTFNLLRIMVHYPYNWYAVNIRRDLVKHPVLCLPLFLKFISYFLSPFNIPCLKLCFVNVEEPKKKWNFYVMSWIQRDNISDNCKAHWRVSHIDQ